MTLIFYISKRYLKGLLWAFLSILFLIILIDGSDQVNYMSKNGHDIVVAIKSTTYRLPSIIIDTIPLIIMIGSLITFISLSKSNELTIIKSSGKSALRLLLIPILITFFIGIITTLIGNPIVSSSIKASESFLDNLGLSSKKFLSISEEGIWLREESILQQTVLKAERTNSEGNALYNITIFVFDGEDNLLKRINSEKGILKKNSWELINGTIWETNKNKNEDNIFNFEDFQILNIKTSLSKSQILDSFADPKAINFWYLPSFIKNLESSGFSALRHKLFYKSEIARPFFLIAMFLIGAIFALKHSRFSHTSILVLTSISSGFVLFSVKRIAESFGSVQEIPILLATFGPSISGILICLGFLLHFEDG